MPRNTTGSGARSPRRCAADGFVPRPSAAGGRGRGPSAAAEQRPGRAPSHVQYSARKHGERDQRLRPASTAQRAQRSRARFQTS